MSAHISIARLVPIYTSGWGALSKREAVKTVTELRLSSNVARGKGNRANRRADQIEAFVSQRSLREAAAIQ